MSCFLSGGLVELINIISFFLISPWNLNSQRIGAPEESNKGCVNVRSVFSTIFGYFLVSFLLLYSLAVNFKIIQTYTHIYIYIIFLHFKVYKLLATFLCTLSRLIIKIQTRFFHKWLLKLSGDSKSTFLKILTINKQNK